MRLRTFFKPNLLRLVLTVAILAGLAMLVTAFYASYTVQRQMLVHSALEGNHAYSTKLAETTTEFLRSAQQQLEFSAEILGQRFTDVSIVEETERLWLQTDTFNSTQ